MSHKEGKRRRQLERATAEQFLLAAGVALQERFGVEARAVYDSTADFRPPCHTCALNPQTNNWPGQAKTILRFLAALERSEQFYCHDEAPRNTKGDWVVDTGTAPLCAGYRVLQSGPNEALTMALRAAFTAIGRPAPEGPEADRIMHSTLLQMIGTVPTKMSRLLSGPRVAAK